MRHSNHSDRAHRLPIWAVGLFGVILAACGSAPAASAPPTPAPTPVVTPDPHLREPVTADQIFRALAAAKLRIIPNNATAGGDPDIVKQINADLASWPLRITEFRSAKALASSLGWTPGKAPGRNDAPYAFAAFNVLVQYGPISGRAPATPDDARQQVAASILAVLDPLLWPVLQHSVEAIPGRTAEPTATPPAPSVSPKPARTPKPSKAP